MIHTLETTCPLFTGFYESAPGAIIDDAIEDAYDYNILYNPEYTQGKSDIRYDWQEIAIDISKRYCGEIEQRLKRDLNIFVKITFESLHSPKEYNFSTDAINCSIKIHDESIARIKAYLIENYKVWRVYLEDTFKSRSGFASFYPYDMAYHLDNLLEQNIFSHALTFMLRNEDSDMEIWICDEIKGNVSLNYTVYE